MDEYPPDELTPRGRRRTAQARDPAVGRGDPREPYGPKTVTVEDRSGDQRK